MANMWERYDRYPWSQTERAMNYLSPETLNEIRAVPVYGEFNPELVERVKKELGGVEMSVVENVLCNVNCYLHS